MHETSLGRVIRDYLTGEPMTETTYEEFRQGLARMLVEEKGYPREALRPRVEVDCGGGESREVSIAVDGPEGRPVLLVFFCSGEVGSYKRETVAAARVYQDGPVPLVLVTDTRDAVLTAVCDGTELGEGMRAVPDWDRLLELAGENPCPSLSPDRLDRERRILKTYSGFLKGCCGSEDCENT